MCMYLSEGYGFAQNDTKRWEARFLPLERSFSLRHFVFFWYSVEWIHRQSRLGLCC
jgi:hypothetical protein